MSTREIETAISKLNGVELSELSDWFLNYRAERWYDQVAMDYRAESVAADLDESHCIINPEKPLVLRLLGTTRQSLFG